MPRSLQVILLWQVRPLFVDYRAEHGVSRMMDTVKIIMDLIVCATLTSLVVICPHLVTVRLGLLHPTTRPYVLLSTEGTRVRDFRGGRTAI